MNKIYILLLMFLLHVIDDFKLQGLLATLKQKSWWKQNYPQDLYKNDWVISLVWHCFQWSMFIMLPIAYFKFHFDVNISFVIVLLINMICHGIVDDLKCNRFKINLITDQLCHCIQIIATWFLFFYK